LARLVGSVGLAGCSGGTDPAWFTDVAAAYGLADLADRAESSDYFMPESIAAGCALFDYDQDGDLDIYLVNGYRRPDGSLDPSMGANRLYRQTADGRFVDVTAESGTGDPGYGMGVAVGDMDNDGDLDIYVSNYGADKLYRNDGGGVFTDVTRQSGLEGSSWSASAGFFDYDNDGLLDLFVTHYVVYDSRIHDSVTDDVGLPEYRGPETLAGVPDTLYHNLGGGVFEDVSSQAGIADKPGKGLGLAFTDLNGDGRPDIYVANDREANFAWIQQADGTFVDEALRMGLAFNVYGRPEASMGIALGDCDGDQDLDLLVTHFVQESHTLYRRTGPAFYEDVSSSSGLGAATVDYTGWGAAFSDLDHDGDLDLLTVSGRVLRTLTLPGADVGEHWNPYAEPNQVFANDGAGHFSEVGDEYGTFCSELGVARGLVAGDVDGDGDLDFLVTGGDGAVKLYRNDVPKRGHWLTIRARDPELRRDAVGARVLVRAGGRRLVREVTHTASYLCSMDASVHFGLGDAARVDEVRVRWPDGVLEAFGPFPVDQPVELVKGTGTATR